MVSGILFRVRVLHINYRSHKYTAPELSHRAADIQTYIG